MPYESSVPSLGQPRHKKDSHLKGDCLGAENETYSSG